MILGATACRLQLYRLTASDAGRVVGAGHMAVHVNFSAVREGTCTLCSGALLRFSREALLSFLDRPAGSLCLAFLGRQLRVLRT